MFFLKDREERTLYCKQYNDFPSETTVREYYRLIVQPRSRLAAEAQWANSFGYSKSLAAAGMKKPIDQYLLYASGVVGIVTAWRISLRAHRMVKAVHKGDEMAAILGMMIEGVEC